MKRHLGTGVGVLMALLALASCTQEKRVIYSNSMLGGVAGAKTQSPDIDLRNGQTGDDPNRTKTVIENADGTKTLIARNPKHLMNHIVNMVREDDADTFVSQVLSARTREEYTSRGLDPKQAFETIKARQTDLLNLFKTMPMANQTPGVFLESMGQGVKRMMAEQRIAVDLKWKGIDMVFERGNYKLVWFVE